MEALEMERPMSEWNDDRLDELNGRVKDGFEKVDKRFEQVDKRFDKVATRDNIADIQGRIAETNGRLDQLAVRMDRLYWAFIVLVLMWGGNLVANST
jgi:hypothetical protein